MDQGSEVSTTDLYASHLDSSSAEPKDDVAEARAKIEATRAHMSGTVDAIKDKLSPAHLVEEAKEAAMEKAHDVVSGAIDTVKETASNVAESTVEAFHTAADKVADVGHAVSDRVSEIKQAVADRVAAIGGHQNQPAYIYANGAGTDRSLGATIVDTIKLNPLPAALIGFGVGWLVLSIQKQQRVAGIGASVQTPIEPAYDAYDNIPYESANAYSTGINDSNAPSLTDRASNIAHGISDKVSDVAHNVGQKASDIAQTVTTKASDLSGKASDWAGGVRDSAGQWKDKAGDTVNNFAVQTKAQAGAASDTVVTFVNEQPLAAAGIAFIVGAAFAASLPTTQKENETLGPPRDRLVDQGKGAAQDVAQKVQTVATTAFGQAKDSLSQTVDQAKQQIQDTVHQAHDTVVSEAHNQGLVATPA